MIGATELPLCPDARETSMNPANIAVIRGETLGAREPDAGSANIKTPPSIGKLDCLLVYSKRRISKKVVSVIASFL